MDRGQIEAARSLGLSPWHTFRFVVGPQALRIILAPLGNDFVSMIKDSALGVQDITQLGKVYSSGAFKFFETYNVVPLSHHNHLAVVDRAADRAATAAVTVLVSCNRAIADSF